MIKFLKKQRIVHLLYRMLFPTDEKGWFSIPLRDRITLANIWKMFICSNQYFGGLYLYQSYEPLNVPGSRPTEKRFKEYNLEEIIKPTYKVLDIGCNMGFFSLYSSRYAKKVVGFDINENLIEIANYAKERLGIDNVDFHHGDFNSYQYAEKFDVIYAFAVYKWIGVSMNDLLDRIKPILNDGGYVLIESNNYHVVEEEFELDLDKIRKDEFSIVDSGYTNYETRRKYVVLKYSSI